MRLKLQLAFFSALISCFVVGCGGGGGGSGDGGGSTVGPPANNPPTANAGADLTVDEHTVVQITGLGSDVDGDPITYSWAQTSGPAVALSSTSSPDVSFDAPAVDIDVTDDVILSLTVADSKGATATDEVTIHIESKDFLLFEAWDDTGSFRELFKYSTNPSSIIKLSADLVVGGTVTNYTLSPDGRFVAYIADQDADSLFELFVAATDGSNVVKINSPVSSIAGGIQTFKWSPDSTKIIYLQKVDSDSIFEVYLADRGGLSAIRISGDASGIVERRSNISWSPDGRFIAHRVIGGNGFPGLWVEVYDTSAASPSSMRVSPLDPPENASMGLGAYIWSPSSEFLFLVGDMETLQSFELYTVRPDGSDHTKVSVPLGAKGSVDAAGWSPSSDSIAYIADAIGPSIRELFSVSPDGTNSVKVSTPQDPSGEVHEFRWAPDGSKIAYSGTQDALQVVELFTALPDGTDKAKINSQLVANGNVGKFVWSPDSVNLSFIADAIQDETFEIFVGNAFGTSTLQISGPLVAPATASFPFLYDGWAADGSKLLYLVTENGVNRRLMVSDSSGSNITRIADEIPAGQWISRGGLWSADGSRVAYTGGNDADIILFLHVVGPDGANNVNVSELTSPFLSVEYDSLAWSP